VATLRPTQYRYAVLIERAKQLVQLAAQLESSMLAALEKSDQAAYNVFKARQDLGLTQANVQLQNLRLTQANDTVTLASLQQTRAQIQARTYQDWIDAGLNEWEQSMIDSYGAAGDAQRVAAGFDAMAQIALAYTTAATAGVGAGVAATLAFGAQLAITARLDATGRAISAQTQAQVSAVYASYERRRQEWELQEALANQDLQIGTQQVQIGNDGVQVVDQERTIAQIQATNAKDTVAFLSQRFANQDLYDWMSNTLQGVYSFFLQQASTIAKLAENQLAFERQEMPPACIQANYWSASSDALASGPSSSASPDRHGLTGSARLLQDIYQLDQYAFDTNKRKLQLSKTISLARLIPAEFQRFRETGVLSFATSMEMFDRDFPGHYLRLIKRVRTSVLALIPAVQGIHATLTTSGLSRVAIGGDLFQIAPIRRDPELVALSSPVNATGLFELETQSDLLLPFEGSGIDTTWELRLPKAANLFDYRTIADVLISIEYTALNSFDYYQQVVQTMKPTVSADRPFSFRNEFADQWYDLHNPDQATPPPMTIHFTTTREDFSSNLDALEIQQVLLYFSRANSSLLEVPVIALRFTEQNSSATFGGGATSIDGVISTRRGNAGSWTAMIGRTPIGTWELALPDTEEIRSRFKNEEIEDILFIVTYSGRTATWPA
jgi:hypothetical protein